MTKVTVSMPQAAVDKITSDPEGFKQFCKENEFNVTSVKPVKRKAVKIEIGFSESPHIQGQKPVFTCMHEANLFFMRHNTKAAWARDDGKLLGYYKTDFKITFEDGHVYEGRYDIGCDAPDLTTHIRHFSECYSGRVKPSHLKKKQWEQFLRNYVSQSSREYFGNILDNYDLEN